MNSGELKVNVPLAAMESDVDDDDDDLATAGAPPPPQGEAAAGRLRAGAFSKSRSSSANRRASPRFNLDQASAAAGGESVTGSLEDLVNSFDDKLTKVFHDYQEQVDKIAPVQVRSQEEIMNECQVWWTITGNFGNMMPIDWSKSTTRAKHLPTLNLRGGGPQQQQQLQPVAAAVTRRTKQMTTTAQQHYSTEERLDQLEDEDDMVAADLDMHSLILSSNPTENAEPLKSADEVIKEIDSLMEDKEDLDDNDCSAANPTSVGGSATCPSSSSASLSSTSAAAVGKNPHHASFGSYQRSSRIVSQALAGRKLDDLSTNELTQILTDIEILVRDLSEELVRDLELRDHLEYEKELKNTFISLLLSIQSKRRQHAADGGKTRKDPKDQYKYLTTVIPYQPERGAPPLPSLQVLVKILKAINEDSPAVPALLTDYILKVLCPS